MSDEVKVPAGDDMENRIREAYDQLPEIAKRRKTSRMIRIAALLTYILIIGLGLWSAINTVKENVIDRSPELATALQENISGVMPTLEKQAQVTAGTLIPKLQAELGRAQQVAHNKFVNELTGENGAAAKMKAGLASDLDNEIAQNIVGTEDNPNSQIRVLQNKYPNELKCDPTNDSPAVCAQKNERSQQMAGLLVAAQQHWAQGQLGKTFGAHFDEMTRTAAIMSKFSAAVGDKADVSNDAPKDMLMLWIEFAGEAMAGNNDMFEAPAKGKK